ncbi:hypothetical protein GCM10010289_66770 [Streptomyces violascens]|uniref:Uncharacterized protein n=1 Tax=Streptomyces violascens TaxID=67381 RepID=A0ABQ3QLN4_9ACTN|nr:hypothetical protein GCM10010289_66770 [Streptomyces violascens]GHI38176.1 hypothetical protein Sviol_25840 [Streptomyces violascens]
MGRTPGGGWCRARRVANSLRAVRGRSHSSPRPQDIRSGAGRGRFSRSSPRPGTPPSASDRGWLVAQFPAPLAASVLAGTGIFSLSWGSRRGSGAEPQGPNHPTLSNGRAGGQNPRRTQGQKYVRM